MLRFHSIRVGHALSSEYRMPWAFVPLLAPDLQPKLTFDDVEYLVFIHMDM